MTVDDQIYQLFSDANPAPADFVATIERPTADALLRDSRRSQMLTREPDTRPIRLARPPRRRGPLLAFATFVVVVVALGVTLWIGTLGDDGGDAVDGTTTSTTTAPTTTTVAPTTTLPPVITPETVDVPDLSGMTLGEARNVLTTLGLTIDVATPVDDSAVIYAQDPFEGEAVESGSTVLVDARLAATCEPPVPGEPQASQADISLLFQCDSDGVVPGDYYAVQRLVPLGDGEPIDRIEWTLRSLLGGPSEEERMAGFTSFFDLSTTEALDSVTLNDGHVVADFNDAIVVNNAGTSTGSVFFNAELRANLFQHPEVDSIELRVNGSCEDWSRLFQSDGCWIITRADWDQQVADWDSQRDG